MKNPIRNKSLAIVLTSLALCGAAPATSLMRLTLAEMAHASPVIVRAKCVANRTGWDAGEIWTFTSFAVEETWKGASPQRVSVRLIGGRVGNLTSTVSEVPRFHTGEDVVLFLQPTLRGDYSVVSWMQGTFRIRRDPRSGEARVTQDTAAFAVFDPATRKFETSGVREAQLENFRAQVSEAVRAGARRRP